MSPDPREANNDEPIARAIVAQWAAIASLLDELEDPLWSVPTRLPGWAVRDVIAHLLGTEASVQGERAPEPPVDVTNLQYVHNAIGVGNERWVQALRSEPPAMLRRRYRDVIAGRTETILGLGPVDFEAPTRTPIGEATFRRYLEIRVFDCWMHEQDIRWVVDRPGHEDGPCAEASLDEVVRALGYIVGKQAAAPDGCSVTIELTGPIHRTLHVVVEGRARVVPALPRAATAAIRLPSSLFLRLAGGRVDPGPSLAEITLEGDEALARKLATSLAFTI